MVALEDKVLGKGNITHEGLEEYEILTYSEMACSYQYGY